MKHDISWFTARKNKEVVRIYDGLETKVVITGDKADKYIEYFHGLQEQGFTFKDTGATIATQAYDFDLPEVEQKKAGKPRIHVSDVSCQSCSA